MEAQVFEMSTRCRPFWGESLIEFHCDGTYISWLYNFGTDSRAGWGKSTHCSIRKIHLRFETQVGKFWPWALPWFSEPVTGLCISRGETLAGGSRWFPSRAGLNRIFLGIRKWIQVFSRVVLCRMLEFSFGSSFITRTMWLTLFPSSLRLPGYLDLQQLCRTLWRYFSSQPISLTPVPICSCLCCLLHYFIICICYYPLCYLMEGSWVEITWLFL